MQKRVSLRKAVDILAEQGVEVEWDDLGLREFFSYYDIHYKEMLEHGSIPSVRFFIEDIKEIFK